jgi:3'-phosphoadenosine 5'-phosphosulfate sulfotransferase (PAPS reductase)/FAD synthetase
MAKKNKEPKPKMYIASCSFGKDSIATILLALEHNEPLDRVVFSEVMFDHERNISGELPEHIEWVYNVAIPKLESMGVKVDVVKAKKDYVSLCKTILKKGKNAGRMYQLQNCFPCYANSALKIAPIKQYYTAFNKQYDITQYVGIAKDEPKRLARLKGTNKVSLLDKYGYTEQMAMDKCKEYSLLSPCYSSGYESRGGCWFCFNANIRRYINIRSDFPEYWQALRNLYYETNSTHFKYDKSLEQIERLMDAYEWQQKNQLNLFE